MRYDLTDKLKFNEDPTICIRETEISVKTDAEIVLRLMSFMTAAENRDANAIAEVVKLLFSADDQKKLKALRLKAEDYLMVIHTAVQLALGADPDEPQPGE